MKKTFLAALLTVGLAVPAQVRADESSKSAKAVVAESDLKMISLPELKSLQKEGKVTVLDANDSETRTKYGIIPGAKLLSSSHAYDIAKELPASKDQKLVFYCANPQCMASHDAAKRAMAAGYKDVSVLPAGIMGWKKSL
jgi:rhodanese-related sulfurtransferase